MSCQWFRGRPELDRQEVLGEPDEVFPKPRTAARRGRACRLGRSLAREARGHAGRTGCIAAERSGADRGLKSPRALSVLGGAAYRVAGGTPISSWTPYGWRAAPTSDGAVARLGRRLLCWASW